MNRLYLAVLLTIFSSLLFAQTNVTGNQSGVWALSGSPYLVLGDINVPEGQTLTIEAGVEVNFQGYYKLYVAGNLQAIGSESAMIKFTTDTPAIGWGGIRVDSSEIVGLKYCWIEHGYATGEYPGNHGGGLALLTSDAIVDHCTFVDNETAENGTGGAIYSINATTTVISNNTFIANNSYGEGGAIKVSGGADILIQNNQFLQNYCNYGGGAITFYSAYNAKINENSFIGNYTNFADGGAIQSLGFGGLLYFANNSLTNNQALNGDGGAVSLAYTSAYFVNTIVYQNAGMYSDDVNVGIGSSAEVYYSNMPLPLGATGHHNLDVNPQFMDVMNNDLSLQSISQCIDAGIAHFEANGEIMVDLLPPDYGGVAPDIGAIEFINVIEKVFTDGFESSAAQL